MVQYNSKQELQLYKYQQNKLNMEDLKLLADQSQLQQLLRQYSILKLDKYQDKDHSTYDIVDYSLDQHLLKSGDPPNELLLVLLVKQSQSIPESKEELLLVKHSTKYGNTGSTEIITKLRQVSLNGCQDIWKHGIHFDSSLNMCLQLLTFSADKTFRLNPTEEEVYKTQYNFFLNRPYNERSEELQEPTLRLMGMLAYEVKPLSVLEDIQQYMLSHSTGDGGTEIFSNEWPDMLFLPAIFDSDPKWLQYAGDIIPGLRSPDYLTICLKGSTVLVQIKIDSSQRVYNIDDEVFGTQEVEPENRTAVPKILLANSKCDLQSPARYTFCYPNTSARDESIIDDIVEQKFCSDVCIYTLDSSRYQVTFRFKDKPVDWQNVDNQMQPADPLLPQRVLESQGNPNSRSGN